MKTGFKNLILCVLLLSTSHYTLADCQISLSQHDVDYGKIKRGDVVDPLKPWSALSERSVRLTVYCQQPQKMAVFFAGTLGDKGGFKFGEQSAVALIASQATLDGHEVTLNHTDIHEVFAPAGQSGQRHLVRAGQGIIPVSNGQVLSGQQFSFTMNIKPLLRKDEFSVQDSHTVNSSVHIYIETEQAPGI